MLYHCNIKIVGTAKNESFCFRLRGNKIKYKQIIIELFIFYYKIIEKQTDGQTNRKT